MPKDILIHTTKLVPILGAGSFPTSVFYDENQRIRIGHDAYREAGDSDQVARDFKVALGEISPGKSPSQRRKFQCGDGSPKSAFEISKDFLETVVKLADEELSKQSIQSSGKILIAEPLAFYADESKAEWLSNYRSNIKRILQHRFDHIDFMPEPFAVFQYYKYGFRDPVLQHDQAINALVVDFGGGTFDVSLVRTTKQGDVSQSGKHSKPLSAESVNIGGYEINRVLATEIICAVAAGAGISDKKLSPRPTCALYKRWLKGEIQLDDLNDAKRAFVLNLHKLVEHTEQPKIKLSSKVCSWTLEGDDGSSVDVRVPRNPWATGGETIDYSLNYSFFRDVFTRLVWKPHLKPAIKRALENAKKELMGSGVDVVLLSGGSANIGWLKKLMFEDFGDELRGAEPFDLFGDYQEIVAKGLAIECVRRLHESDSEFRFVTYNNLFLRTGSNGDPVLFRSYRPRSGEIESDADNPGELLRVASGMKQLIDKPLRWSFRLNKAPSQYIQYEFRKSNEEFAGYLDQYNLDTDLPTPRGSSVSRDVFLELTISADGTCRPKFIYKDKTNNTPEYSALGAPFVIDMTVGAVHEVKGGYLGLDFGSSNSALALVREDEFQLQERKARPKFFRTLTQAVEELPFPIAANLSNYLAADSEWDRLVSAVDTLEAILAFVGYTACAEALSVERSVAVVKTGPRRSMGPLRNLLEASIQALGSDAQISRGFATFVQENGELLGQWIADLNDARHSKRELTAPYLNEIVHSATRMYAEGSQGLEFLMSVRSEASGLLKPVFGGAVKRAIGRSTQFLETLRFQSRTMLPEYMPVMFDRASGRGLVLAPFYAWEPPRKGEVCPQLYVLDEANDPAVFKNVAKAGTKRCSELGLPGAEYQEVVSLLRSGQFTGMKLDNFKILETNEE